MVIAAEVACGLVSAGLVAVVVAETQLSLVLTHQISLSLQLEPPPSAWMDDKFPEGVLHLSLQNGPERTAMC